MSQARFKILEKYNFQVPRYTSYPPATQFRDIENPDAYSQWLSGADKDISLYIHIPFCARLCHYCGCHMRVVNNYQPVGDYLDVLKTEMVLLKARLPRHVRLSHLHFGGGSPTIIKPADFRRLVQTIEQSFPFASGMEMSIEADPRNLSEAKIASYAKSGVNRISLGVQDFNEEVLALINRPQPFHITYRALQICKSYGIDNINFDLMYGLPGQTAESILKTMDMAISLRPTRISYFGYAHVPWMKRHMNLMPQDRIPGPKDRYVLQEVGARRLESVYIPVGIDHYALPHDSMVRALAQKKLHRNFQGYTTDTARYLLGLGASSISALPQGYVQNTINTRLYMQQVQEGVLPVHKMLAFKANDLPVRRIIEELMCYLHTDLDDVRRDFALSPSYFQSAMQKLKPLEEDGIVSIRGQQITIQPEFRVLARVVCEVFDEYAIKDLSLQRHAPAI